MPTYEPLKEPIWATVTSTGEMIEIPIFMESAVEEQEAIASGDYEPATPEEREELDSLGSSNS